MLSVNTSVAYTLISLTGLGVVFYIGVVIVGMSPYECPFQTPSSTALRGPQEKIRRGIVSFVHFKSVLLWTHRTRNRGVQPLPHRQSLPTISLVNVQVRQFEPRLKQKDLDMFRRTNINDARCVSWIPRNITDREALDAAIRLAGEIRWFDNGTYVNLPYDLVVSTYEACFDSTGKLYPGSRDRAYYSGRAISWINALSMCKSQEYVGRFPANIIEYAAPGLDPDLKHLLQVGFTGGVSCIVDLLTIRPEYTPSHSQWISDVLLHHCWANRAEVFHQSPLRRIPFAIEAVTTIPLNARLNRVLAWCIFLGSPPKEEVLEIRGKS